MKDITMTITVYNRLEYVQRSLASLEELGELPFRVVVIDDHSDEQTHSYLEEVCSRNGWDLFRNEENLGATANNITRSLYVDTEWMYISDSDVIYSSKFVTELRQLYDLCKEVDGIGSLFNTSGSGRHLTILDVKDRYFRKASIGGVSMLIKRDLFAEITADHTKHLRTGYTGWDYAVVFYCNENNVPIWVTKNSYIDHIGVYGAHSFGVSDKAINFVP